MLMYGKNQKKTAKQSYSFYVESIITLSMLYDFYPIASVHVIVCYVS